jgi:hypothetical protein
MTTTPDRTAARAEHLAVRDAVNPTKFIRATEAKAPLARAPARGFFAFLGVGASGAGGEL